MACNSVSVDQRGGTSGSRRGLDGLAGMVLESRPVAVCLGRGQRIIPERAWASLSTSG
jgi:hypothetical protein